MTAKQITIGRLCVLTHPDRDTMGAAAANQAAQAIHEAITEKKTARIIVASAPSQIEFFACLTAAPGIDWSKVTIFQADEYTGIPENHPASFRSFHREHLLAKITPAAFHGIQGESQDPEAECNRYAALLAESPIDLLCLGILHSTILSSPISMTPALSRLWNSTKSRVSNRSTTDVFQTSIPSQKRPSL